MKNYRLVLILFQASCLFSFNSTIYELPYTDEIKLFKETYLIKEFNSTFNNSKIKKCDFKQRFKQNNQNIFCQISDEKIKKYVKDHLKLASTSKMIEDNTIDHRFKRCRFI